MLMNRVCALFFVPICIYSQDSPRRFSLEQIRAEANRNSKAGEYAFYLTDVYGPRLTGSPAFAAAGQWTIEALKAAGMTNVHIEPLSGLGKGWSYRWFSVHLKQPQSAALTGVPYPWSRSTQGRQTGAPIFTPQPATTSRDRGGESEHGNDGP